MPLELDPAATPAAIEARSFAVIESELPEPRPFKGALWEVARRCIHALGDTAILPDLRMDAAALERGLAALRAGCVIFTDTRMAAAGLPRRRMDLLGAEVIPLMGLPGLSQAASAQGLTQAAAGIRMIANRLAGSLVVIGNAPTALLALLEELQGRAPEDGPALIVGMPVGFVNAAQSKEMLAQSPWPHFTLLGRKGGSAAAAACVNALAELALREMARANKN